MGNLLKADYRQLNGNRNHLLLDLLLLVLFGWVGCLLKVVCEPNPAPKPKAGAV